MVESGVAPSLNVTVPVGVPAPTPVTVAIRITAWPNTAALVEETSAVLVSALLIVSTRAGEFVLVLKLLSPL